MPEGAPPPGSSSQPTIYPGAVAPGQAPVADAVQALAISTATQGPDNTDHQSWWPSQIATGVPLAYAVPFGAAQKFVLTNATTRRLMVRLAGPPSFQQAGYDWLVPPLSELAVRVIGARTLFVTPVDAAQPGDNGVIDLFAYAGVFAAQGEAYVIRALGAITVQAPAQSNQATATVAGGNSLAWFPNAADPFSGSEVYSLLSVFGEVGGAAAAGSIEILVPAPGPANNVVPIDLAAPATTFETVNLDLAGVQVGGQNTPTTITGAAADVNLTFIYR